jgi:hypothetical protein
VEDFRQAAGVVLIHKYVAAAGDFITAASRKNRKSLDSAATLRAC